MSVKSASSVPVYCPKMDVEDLNNLIDSSPHCRALGIRANEKMAGNVSLLLKAQPFLGLCTDVEIWHPGAIGSALDNVLSMGALSTIPPDSRPATLDLRWDLFNEVPLCDIVLTATSAHVTPKVVYVQGEMADADTGVLFGHAIATIAYSPPVGPSNPRQKADEPEVPTAIDFPGWLSLSTIANGRSEVPYKTELAGSAGVPFWHGGALIAAMTAAAVMQAQQAGPGLRLLTATASFDVFALDQTVSLNTEGSRTTRTRTSVYTTCSQEGRGITSRLAAHFGKVGNQSS